MAQMQTLSIRVPDDDFQWLLSRQEAGAKTPSEKLRALLTKTRLQEAGMADYEACAEWMRSLAQPFADAISLLERNQKIHSDLIATVVERVPRMMATLIAERPTGARAREQAIETEAVLAQQCFRLLATVLRAGVTTTPATYDKELFDRFLPEIIEIVILLSNRHRKESNHG